MNEKKINEQKNEMVCDCACSYSGVCNDCRYYGTWHGDPWCDRYNQEIRDSSREKDCYER